jgi:hypothetical protein
MLARRTLLVALAAIVADADAQSPPPRTALCFEERGPGACSSTLIAVPGVHAMVGTSADADFENLPNGATSARVRHFKPYQFTLAVSLLRDVRRRDAAGAFFQVGLASKQQVRTALGARYRWRLGDSVSLDVSPGAVRMYMQGERFNRPADFEPRIGGTVDVDLHLSHWLIIGSRLDVIPTDRSGTAVGIGAGLKIDGFAGARVVLLLAGLALAAAGYVDILSND